MTTTAFRANRSGVPDDWDLGTLDVVAAPVKRHALLWIAVTFGVLVLSVIAVWVRAAAYPEYVPPAIVRALDYFVEPGAAVWWMTIGKAFQAFPSDFPGYAVVSVANTAVWSGAGAIVIMGGRVGVRGARRLTPRGSGTPER